MSGMRRSWVRAGLATVVLGACTGGVSTDDPDDTDAGVPGTEASTWRRAFADVTLLDTSGGVPTSARVPLDTRLPMPEDDREVDTYVVLDGDRVLTLAWVVGDEAWYRIARPVTRVDDVWSWYTDDGSYVLMITDGHLTETAVVNLDGRTVMSQAVFDAVATFPPTGWPSDVIDVDLPAANP